MKIVYRPAAINDINSTSDYLKNELKNPQAAQRLKEHILHTISLLKDNPEIGPLLSSKYDTVENNYRYIIVNKQIVFYEINDNTIEIIRVLDGRTVNAAAEGNCAGAIADGIFELVHDGRLVQDLVAVRCRVVRIFNHLVTLRINNIKFIEGVAVHGAGHKAHIVRMFRFNKYNSEFTHE